MELRDPFTRPREKRSHSLFSAIVGRRILAERPRERCVSSAVLLVMAVLVAVPAQANIVFDLVPRGSTYSYGHGARGLYIGNNYTYPNHDRTNWDFIDVQLSIDCATGEGTISGGIRHGDDPAGLQNWRIENLSLMDLEFRDRFGVYANGGNYNGGMTPEHISRMLQGRDPFTNEDWSGFGEWGFEWASLTMLLSHTSGYNIPVDNWDGNAMPSMGHPLVAELHWDPVLGALTFEAWYINQDQATYYNSGDTKANAVLFSSGDTSGLGPGPVPEPSAIVLAALGALALVVLRLKR